MNNKDCVLSMSLAELIVLPSIGVPFSYHFFGLIFLVYKLEIIFLFCFVNDL